MSEPDPQLVRVLTDALLRLDRYRRAPARAARHAGRAAAAILEAGAAELDAPDASLTADAASMPAGAPLSSTASPEILCVPAAAVTFTGFVRHSDLLDRIEAEGVYLPRAEAEQDERFRQVIPYVVITDGERVFATSRLAGSGEQRLHGRLSLGIGGHVERIDGGFAAGLAREWDEEIDADFRPDFLPIGYIADDRDQVGRVHVGVVFRVPAQGRPVTVRETDVLAGAFLSRAELAAARERLEGWGGLVADHVLLAER